MPIKHAIWIVGEKPVPLPQARIASEQLLEDMIEGFHMKLKEVYCYQDNSSYLFSSHTSEFARLWLSHFARDFAEQNAFGSSPVMDWHAVRKKT